MQFLIFRLRLRIQTRKTRSLRQKTLRRGPAGFQTNAIGLQILLSTDSDLAAGTGLNLRYHNFRTKNVQGPRPGLFPPRAGCFVEAAGRLRGWGARSRRRSPPPPIGGSGTASPIKDMEFSAHESEREGKTMGGKGRNVDRGRDGRTEREGQGEGGRDGGEGRGGKQRERDTHTEGERVRE